MFEFIDFPRVPFVRFVRHYWNFAKTRDAARAAAGPFRPISCHTRRDTQRGWAIPSSRPISVEYSFFLSSSAFGYVVGILFGATALCGRFLISLWDYCISNGRHSSCFSALCGRLEFRRNYSTCFHPTLCGRLEYRKDLSPPCAEFRKDLFYMFSLEFTTTKEFILHGFIPPCAADWNFELTG